MIRPHRSQPLWYAFILHRLSGIGLALFLPLHFYVLGLALGDSADYIIERLARAPRGTVVIVDYLQLLDQNRSKPGLAEQVRALKAFADRQQVIIVFVSQIDRAFDLSGKPCPGLGDVRLPNPLDLGLFSRACFLNDGEIRLSPG